MCSSRVDYQQQTSPSELGTPQEGRGHCNPLIETGGIEFQTLPTLVHLDILEPLSCQVPKFPPHWQPDQKGQKQCIPRTGKKERVDYNIVYNDGSYCVFPLFAPLTYYIPFNKRTWVGVLHWHVQVATSAVWPKGQVPATKKEKTISEPIHNRRLFFPKSESTHVHQTLRYRSWESRTSQDRHRRAGH
jgi:hypothetical protein